MDKVTISRELLPLNIDDVKCWTETALQLTDCIERELLCPQMTVRMRTASALLFALVQQIEELDRHAEATLQAEFAAERENQNHLLQDSGKKKSAPTAGTADALNPKTGAMVGTLSIAQTEGKGKC